MGLFQLFAPADSLLTQYSARVWPKVSPPALSDPLPGSLSCPDTFSIFTNQPAGKNVHARLQTHLIAESSTFLAAPEKFLISQFGWIACGLSGLVAEGGFLNMKRLKKRAESRNLEPQE